MPVFLLVAYGPDWADSLNAVRTGPSRLGFDFSVQKVEDSIDAAAYAVPKKPGTAAWWSALVPGGGQFYNGQFLKGLAIAGLEGFLFFETAQKYAAYRKEPEDSNLSPALNYGFFLLGAWGFSIADAYAFAYMSDFSRRTGLVIQETKAPETAQSQDHQQSTQGQNQDTQKDSESKVKDP